jgi:hypothetical protein
MWRNTCLVLTTLAAALVSGCSHPDVRSAVYDTFGPTAVYLEPPRGADDAAKNWVRFMPGSVVEPSVKLNADHWGRRAAQWGSKSTIYCPPRPSLFRFTELPQRRDIPDVHINYDFELSLERLLRSVLQLRALEAVAMVATPADMQARAAVGDFKVPAQVLTYVRRIEIHFTNIVHFHAPPAKLQAALRDIAAGRRCSTLDFRNRHIVTDLYSADIDVRVIAYDGIQIELPIIEASIMNYLGVRRRGRNLFFVAQANPSVSN